MIQIARNPRRAAGNPRECLQPKEQLRFPFRRFPEHGVGEAQRVAQIGFRRGIVAQFPAEAAGGVVQNVGELNGIAFFAHRLYQNELADRNVFLANSLTRWERATCARASADS